MNKLTRILFIGIVVALVLSLGIPALAQERETGEGAPIIQPNFGADIATLNPIISNDGTSNDVIANIFPGFVGIDPETGFFEPNMPQNVVTGWEISDDGLVYTFTLREDYFWSDGTPVTSTDVIYFWEAINDTSVNVSGSYTDLRSLIESVEAPDDYTVVVTFLSPDCNAINSAALLNPVPAHYYSEIYPELSDMNDSQENLNPAVTAGPYTFRNFRPGEQVTLVANPDYADGPTVPAGWIYKNVADQTLQVEQFLNDQLTFSAIPQSRHAELLELIEAGEYLGYESSRANMRFLSFNNGDPTNPQPGLDEDGNPIDQGLHPIFGDVRVRQALNYAMNFDEINEGVFFGLGEQMATHSRPDNWAHPEITPYPFDTEQAAALLDEAGWVDGDGDGVRECTGCLYATEVDPEFEGSSLAFELLTNAGNVSQEALGVVLQDQWGEVGADVTFQPIDFNVLVEQFIGQDYDAIMIFWGFGYPFDPDGTGVVFAAENDIPNSGFNTQSYYNSRVEEILDEARALPGCDIETRKALYEEMYLTLQDDAPWIWIGVGKTLAAAQTSVEGWEPKPLAASQTLWNQEYWYVAP